MDVIIVLYVERARVDPLYLTITRFRWYVSSGFFCSQWMLWNVFKTRVSDQEQSINGILLPKSKISLAS